MHSASDWWSRSAFIRDYFFMGQQKVAHQLAEYLARYYVGDEIAELRPSTDVSAMIGDSIRRYIDEDDFSMARDDNPLAEIDLMEHITFQQCVDIVHAQRKSAR